VQEDIFAADVVPHLLGKLEEIQTNLFERSKAERDQKLVKVKRKILLILL
jgi:hypothetical protein